MTCRFLNADRRCDHPLERGGYTVRRRFCNFLRRSKQCPGYAEKRGEHEVRQSAETVGRKPEEFVMHRGLTERV